MKEIKEKTHWLQSPNKNYLGHWDLPESGELTVTIKSAAWEEVKNPITNKSEAKRVIRFIENIKPMICNQTNAQSIVNVTGVKFMEDSGGCQITLFISSIKDKISKEDIDCIRVKKAKEITLEDVISLRDEKFDLIPSDQIEHLNKVINEQQKERYQRVYNYLSKL